MALCIDPHGLHARIHRAHDICCRIIAEMQHSLSRHIDLCSGHMKNARIGLCYAH